MIHGVAVEEVTSARDVAPQPHEAFADAVKARLIAYLGRLGLRDASLIDTLAEECLHRARRRTAPGSQDELLRRALEEAQRRFDHAIALTLNVAGAKDFRLVAGARAALLLCKDGDSDSLFRRHEELAEMASRLRAGAPVATPPEANLAMPDQPIAFLFSGSSKARK